MIAGTWKPTNDSMEGEMKRRNCWTCMWDRVGVDPQETPCDGRTRGDAEEWAQEHCTIETHGLTSGDFICARDAEGCPGWSPAMDNEAIGAWIVLLGAAYRGLERSSTGNDWWVWYLKPGVLNRCSTVYRPTACEALRAAAGRLGLL